MSPAFSTPGGSLGEAAGPAIMLFVILLALITGVIIYHTVAYRTRPMNRAPGITISRPKEHDRAGF
jgi:hypothetical protein